MTDDEWFRITTAARARAEQMFEHALRMEQPWGPPGFTEKQRNFLLHTEADYEQTILGAWAKYEPTLTPPYAVPNEVERILKKRAQP